MKSVVNYQETSRIRFHRGDWGECELSREKARNTPHPHFIKRTIRKDYQKLDQKQNRIFSKKNM